MTRYELDPEHQWKHVRLDAMDVLYHRPSGQTHILIEPAPQIFDCLLAGPACVQDIYERLSQHFVYEQEGDDSAPINTLLQERLEEMVFLGFVRYSNSMAAS
jgi:PqqD family protein of HPr-rel-A system